MTNVNELTQQGFKLNGQNDLDLAFLSLRIALKAYFSSYYTIKHQFDPDNPDENIEQNINYCESCAETVVHFQHFFELVIKDILRNEHLLLATKVNFKPTVYHKILTNEPLSPSEEEKLQSVEFSTALETICSLIDAEKIANYQDLQFIIDNKNSLIQLNVLRNRLWHRGSFFLNYSALDKFIGKFIFPLIDSITNLSQYKNTEKLWKYEKTFCNIDPIKSIKDAYSASEPLIGKIAILKEIGRAAYLNPLLDLEFFKKQKDKATSKIKEEISLLEKDHQEVPLRLKLKEKLPQMRYDHLVKQNKPHIQKAKKASQHEATNNYYPIATCPVCGVKSLVLYDEDDFFGEPDTGTLKNYNFTYRAKCECCKFDINYELRIEDYSLPIDNYWKIIEQ